MLVLGVIYRTLTWQVFWRAAKETVVISGGILLILGASNLMGQVLAREQVSRNLGEWLTSLTDNPIVFLLLLNVLLILLGIFLEAPPVILVLVPILMPIIAEYGIDPVHLGVIMILNLMIGSLTPPVGAVLFVVGSITRRPMGELFRGILPFLIPLGVVLLLLTLFPVDRHDRADAARLDVEPATRPGRIIRDQKALRAERPEPQHARSAGARAVRHRDARRRAAATASGSRGSWGSSSSSRNPTPSTRSSTGCTTPSARRRPSSSIPRASVSARCRCWTRCGC